MGGLKLNHVSKRGQWWIYDPYASMLPHWHLDNHMFAPVHVKW